MVIFYFLVQPCNSGPRCCWETLVHGHFTSALQHYPMVRMVGHCA
uniref:Uncharacterized protein n=1 Tax=Anguilla anguilla TaxID=7936 RepID=A0A0E9RMZ8_ANGAN